MKTVFFNAFKERLVNGEVPDSFYIDCFPVTDSFFKTFNKNDYKIENFRTVKDLNNLGFSGCRFTYTQKAKFAEYCCEYITEPNFTYKSTKIGDAHYDVIESPRYRYLSAQMNYRYTNVDAAQTKFTNTQALARGIVNYDYENYNYLVHYYNTGENGQPAFTFADGIQNDGTVLFMGHIPEKQQLIDNMCINGTCNDIYPIYGKNFRGFVFADTSGNLINYMDFENPIDFDGGSFVYKYPETWTINNNGTKTKWATLANLV